MCWGNRKTMAKRRCTGNREKKAVTIASPSSGNFWSSSGVQAGGVVHAQIDASVPTKSPSDPSQHGHLTLSGSTLHTHTIYLDDSIGKFLQINLYLL